MHGTGADCFNFLFIVERIVKVVASRLWGIGNPPKFLEFYVFLTTAGAAVPWLIIKLGNRHLPLF